MKGKQERRMRQKLKSKGKLGKMLNDIMLLALMVLRKWKKTVYGVLAHTTSITQWKDIYLTNIDCYFLDEEKKHAIMKNTYSYFYIDVF